MQYSRIIDLSHAMFAGKENRKVELTTLLADMRPDSANKETGRKTPIAAINPEEIPDIPIPEGQYFLMHEMQINNHAGTHIELPSHCLKNGADVSRTPLDLLVGEAIFLGLDDCAPQSEVSLEKIRTAAAAAGGIKRGDICFCRFAYDKHYRTDAYMKNPFFALESIEWLVDQGIKLFGADIGLIERPGNPVHDNHLVMFRHNISVIENMAHLDQVSGHRAFALVLPVNIQGLDSMPVRIVALE